MNDPMTAALDFLTSNPEAQITFSAASPEYRRHMLDDTGHALSSALEMFEMPTGDEHEAALKVFAFAADVWGQYLSRELDSDRAALNLYAWASMQASTPELLPMAKVTAWRAMRHLAIMTTGPGYEDGEPEDFLNALLTSLKAGGGRVLN